MLSGFFGGLSGNQGALRSAFLGAVLGRRLLKKVTFRTVQVIVGIALILLGIGLGAGLL